MKQKLLYIFTRTPLHVGAGSSVGAIDQPVQRERHTGYPIIPGSSVKGVLRNHFSGLGQGVLNDLFGKGDEGGDFTTGKISFGEARLLEVAKRMLHSQPEVMAEMIYRAVDEWTGSPELQDDMTVVVARGW